MWIVQFNMLRQFIFLLLTVFITESVYANGMMIDERNSGSNSRQITINNDNHVEHCHDMQSTPQSQAHSDNKHQSKSSCSNCSHCLACFTMISQRQFAVICMRSDKILASALTETYLSPTSTLLQKPPIA